MRISTTRWTWPELSPFRHKARRERLKYQATPLAMVSRSASAFMCATISTSPELASVATQVTRPSASNLGAKPRPSSTCPVEPRAAKGASSSDKETSPAITTIVARAGGRSKIIIDRQSALRLALGPAHHRDEADLVVRVVPEAAGELRGDGRGAGLLDAAHRHAHVLGFHHHGDAARI